MKIEAIYEIENNQYQVDADIGSFVFSKSRIAKENVEVREFYSKSARQFAYEVLEEARKMGLPL